MTKKKVNYKWFKHNKFACGTPNDGEALSDFISIYSRFFPDISFINHNHEMPNIIENNFVYIYCHKKIKLRGSMISNTVSAFDIPEPLNDFNNEYNPLIIFGSEGVHTNVIEIKLKNNVIAYYLPEKNSMLTCDFTHLRNEGVWANMVEKVLKPYIKTSDKPQKKENKKQKLPQYKITLGADPEGELNIANAYIPANSQFQQEGKVGTDGCASVLELRPDPVTDPKEGVIKLKECLNIIYNKNPQFDVIVKGDNLAIGGHIHFGGVPLDKSFIALLDETLGRYWTPKSGSKRGSYNTLGSHETKSWGFEYRSLPACIYQDPETYEDILSICKYLAEKFFNGNGIVIADLPIESQPFIKRALGKDKDRIKRYLRRLSAPVKEDGILESWGFPRPLVTLPAKSIHDQVPQQSRRPQPQLSITFTDEWDEGVMEYLKESLIANGISGSYRFYGLRKERGNCNVFNSLEAGYLSLPYNPNCFGFSWFARTNIETMIETIDSLLRNITCVS